MLAKNIREKEKQMRLNRSL